MAAERTAQSVTVTIDRELANRTRDAGLNVSAILMAVLSVEFRKHATARQREENAETITALNQLADETGCFSNEYRSSQRYSLRCTAVVTGTLHPFLLLILPATLLVKLTAVSLFH